MAKGPQGILGKLRFGPSDRLITMFRTHPRNPAIAIQDRLICLLRRFLQHHKDSAGKETKDMAAKCCCEATIWFYRILEYHASEERDRLGLKGMTVVFENELLHHCLVACCLEISATPLPCDLILLLQILKLAPYYFWKVIEPVLRAEVGLPCSVRRHLSQVEEKVLKSLAWTKDSPLWEEIQDGRLPTCHQVMPPTQLEDPKMTALRSEGRVELGLGAEQSGSPDQWPSPSQRSKPLHLFTRKVYSLMGKLLWNLCSVLHISDDLKLTIWTCFEYSLVHCTDLMVDRHLDQLLMCAIYIIAKITGADIPFKHIINCYKSHPHTSKSVCNNVLISGKDRENSPAGKNNKGDHCDGVLTPDTPSSHYPVPWLEERGNLICFYNKVYMPNMQHFAKQFASTPTGNTPPFSPYPRQWKASPQRNRLSSIYISVYDITATPPSTPGLCYHFSSSPRERLREINNMIKMGRKPSRRCCQALLNRGKEGEEEEEDGPSLKRARLVDQSALHFSNTDECDEQSCDKKGPTSSS